MQPRRILVLYGTSYGQTAKIARRIGDTFASWGEDVTLVNAGEVRTPIDVRAYDGVIIGASVIRGRHQSTVRKFVRQNVSALNNMPTAFFSVSGSAASPDERGRADARRCVEWFLEETRWRPAITEMVGGAIAYTKYGVILRWIMKQIARRNGGPTDTARDHELTNWMQVENFAARFQARVDSPPSPVDEPLAVTPSGSSTEAAS
jgi:menaquinone-dependent protoporphyrinogen oxidase